MDGTAYWVDSAFDEQEEEPDDEKARHLEVELQNLRKELAEVRKELAAKTVLLSKRDLSDKASQEKWAEQRAAELAAAAIVPKDQVIRSLENTVCQLEVALAQRTEELEESRRLFTSQKRALKDALSAAAEREAAEAEADAAGRSAASAAAEEEMERLMQELAQLKTRSALELQAREAEIQELKQQLQQHEEHRRLAVEEARTAAASEAAVALAAAEASHAAEVAELQAEVNRARSSSNSTYMREEREELSSDLASINKAKVQLQREFDAYKDLTAQTARQHREEQARLLEENAALKARIAAEAARVAMGAPASHTAGPGISLGAARGLLGGSAVRGKTFAAVSEHDNVGGMLQQWLDRLDRQRRGLVPLLVIACLALLIFSIAVVRAAASTHGEHKGAVCFLSKLGIQIGEGCGPALHSSNAAPSTKVAAALADLVEATPRVKDVASTGAVVSAAAADANMGKAAASVSQNESKDKGQHHRMILQLQQQQHWRPKQRWQQVGL